MRRAAGREAKKEFIDKIHYLTDHKVSELTNTSAEWQVHSGHTDEQLPYTPMANTPRKGSGKQLHS